MTIRKLQHGVSKVNGNLLVYIKIDSGKSHLLKIKHSNSSIVDCDTLKTYGNENSSEPSFLATVIRDSRILYPADSYGLVLWSHATSWAPPAQMVTPFTFGEDQKKEMDIKDLKSVLTDVYESFDHNIDRTI